MSQAIDSIVAVLPYALRHEKNLYNIKISSLRLPLGGEVPENLQKVSDLRASDHLIVYCCSSSLFRTYHQLSCKVSILVVEPKAIQSRYYLFLLFLGRKFFKVFTFSESLLKKLPNAIFHSSATAWVVPIDKSSKSKLVSIVASKKNQLPGQKLRHKLIKQCQEREIDLDLFGRGYREVNRKEEALSNYMFSIAIENSQEINYISEKLIDCFLQKVVPVYWGAPNVDEFFDVNGIIYCQSLDELLSRINFLSEDLYNSKSEAIERNYLLAKKIQSPEVAAALKLNDLENP